MSKDEDLGDDSCPDCGGLRIKEPRANGSTAMYCFECHGDQRRDVERDRVHPSTLDGETRPDILISTEEHAVNDQAVAALGADPVIFQQNGVGLVRVLRDSGEEFERTGRGHLKGAPSVGLLPRPILRERLSAVARWWKPTKTGNSAAAHPPDWCVEALAVRGDWPGIRHLGAVIEAPTVRDDGSVIEAAGYDPRTRLLYEPAGSVLPVPREPSKAHAAEALAELQGLVCDFPFQSPAHLAGWVAGLLTPLASMGRDWCAPLFLFDANTRGSGKTLLADLISIIVTTRGMPRMTFSDETEEMRKTIFALALSGEPFAFFDEAQILKGDALNTVLTGRRVKGRLLGESRMVEATFRATLYAAGNNVQVRGDTARRVIHARLESQDEHPEQRTGFRFPDVKEAARKARPRLLQAALTILSAHRRAGSPEMASPLGSFEGWSKDVRDPLIWAGSADPCATRAALLAADSDESALRLLLRGWLEATEDDSAIPVRTAIERLARHPALQEALDVLGCKSGEKVNAAVVGTRLAKHKDRWCGGLRLVKKGVDRNGSALWAVERSHGTT